MIIFWILAGGLLALSLVFVLAPLARPTPPDTAPGQDRLNLEVFQQRLKELDADLEAGFLDKEQYDAARRDLERELLYDLDGAETAATRSTSAIGRWTLALVLVVVIPAATVLAYLEMGQPQLIDRLQAGGTAADANAETAAASLEELLQRLEDRLKEDPANVEGWLMLGRTHLATGQLAAGVKAMEQAYALAPNEIEVKLAYAEALGLADPNKSLVGRPAELIQSALEQEPANANARWMSGLVAFQRGQYQAAQLVWQGILDELDPDSDEAGNLKQMMAEAQRRAGIPATDDPAKTPAQEATPLAADTTRPAPDVAAPVEPENTAGDTESSMPPAEANQARLTVTVRLDPTLADQVSPEDTVFVFARAAEGPPMPLAALRLQVKDLPATVTLDDSQAMNPALRLSAFEQIRVGARVSRSGEATPQAGDPFGDSGPIRRDAQTEIQIAIDRIRP